MKFQTFIVTIERGELDTQDPFSLPMPSAHGTLDDTQGDAHVRRIGALKRVFDHNTREAARPHNPLRWMVAIEIDLRFPVDVCKVWLQGEEGTLEGTVELDFRFMSPSVEEAELLSHRAISGTG